MIQLNIDAAATKEDAFSAVEKMLIQQHLSIIETDRTRPWGGFFKIAESDTQKFIKTFFKDVPIEHVQTSEKLSPKILLVENGKRLSWQYHHRRAEIWKVIAGNVTVVVSNTDHQTEPVQKNLHDVIILQKGERHRLIGNNEWGVIAEIWQHTDVEHPSDEEDIVRVQDDFGR